MKMRKNINNILYDTANATLITETETMTALSGKGVARLNNVKVFFFKNYLELNPWQKFILTVLARMFISMFQ